ncbi:MAG: hypothetical protein HY690_20560, partial [Chloroflexi bacterium]|nr:hypothetical protein [Chloroflexota bacterium]
ARPAVRDRIKAITAPRQRLPAPVQTIVAELNRAVRGWGAYFRVGNPSRHFTLSGLMRAGWKRGQVSGGSACKYCVDSAGPKSHRASLLLYPFRRTHSGRLTSSAPRTGRRPCTCRRARPGSKGSQ